MGEPHDAAGKRRAYFAIHQRELQQLLTKAMNSIIAELPEDPLKFLIETLTLEHLQRTSNDKISRGSDVWRQTAVSVAAANVQKMWRGKLYRTDFKTRRLMRQFVEPSPSSCLVFGSMSMDLRATFEDRWPEIHTGGSFIGEFEAQPGGKGLNQAVATARLGVRTHLVGKIGGDQMALLLREYLSRVEGECPQLCWTTVSSGEAGSASGVAVQLSSVFDAKRVSCAWYRAHRTSAPPLLLAHCSLVWLTRPAFESHRWQPRS